MKLDLPSVKQAEFLAAYSRLGHITLAAAVAGVNRSSHYSWMKEDPTYLERFQAAHEQALDYVEDVVMESATQGIEEPVIYQGQLSYLPLFDEAGNVVRDENGYIKLSNKPLTVRKRNDVAAFFLLKAGRPDKYRENSTVELKGSVDVIVQKLTAGRQRLAKRDEAAKS